MNIFFKILMIFTVVWLQIGFFGHVRPLGVMPNLLLVLVVVSGLLSRATPTLAVAVAGGLLLDLASGADFGLRMAFYTTAALGVIAARQFGARVESAWSAVFLVGLGTLVFDAAVLYSGEVALNSNVVRILLNEVVVNGVVAVLSQLAGIWYSHRRPIVQELGIKP